MNTERHLMGLKIARMVLFLLMLALVVGEAGATTYYVNATGGNDSRSTAEAQNIDTPWLTLMGANGNISSGDTVIVGAGTYDGGNFTQSATWIGTSDNQTIIKSAAPKVYTIVISETENFWNFAVDGGSDTNIIGFNGTISLNNCTVISNTNFMMRTLTSARNLTITNNTLVVIGAPASTPIYLDRIHQNITFFQNSVNSTSTAMNQAVIFGYRADTIDIENNTIASMSFNGPASIYVTSVSSVVTALNIKYNTIYSRSRNNYIIEVGAETATSEQNLVNANISWNTVYGSMFYRPDLTASTHGIFVGHERNATVRGNTVTGAGYGLVIKGSPTINPEGGVFNNTFINCTGVNPVRIKGVKNLTFSGNIINSAQLAGGSADQFQLMISNNTPSSGSIGVHSENNTFTAYSNRMVSVDSESVNGFVSTGNTYSTTNVLPINFSVSDTTYNFQEWQEAGYDVSWPFPAFTLDRTLVLIPQSITANSTSTNSPTLLNWSWGDGSWTNQSGDDPDASHLYSTTGNYPVYLIASNAAGSNTSGIQYVDVILPYSIHNLTNNTPTYSEITWSWEWETPAPIDTVLMIYRNGTFWTNSSNTTTSRLWNNLGMGTNMTFSSKVCYANGGECNQTWVNRTTKTLGYGPDCPTPTPTTNPWVNPPNNTDGTPSDGKASSVFATGFSMLLLVFLIVVVVTVIIAWRMFQKGGNVGWLLPFALSVCVALLIIICIYYLSVAFGSATESIIPP